MKTIEFSNDNVIIVNDKNQAEKIALLEMASDLDAIKFIRKEQDAGKNASVGALTLLVHMLDHERFDAYKGQTPVGEKITPEFRGALRDIEIEYMKPIFVADLTEKGNKPATIEKLWQEYSANLRTGTYALCKSYVSKLFCHLGKLPKTDNGKLIPINAIKEMLNQVKTTNTEKAGIAGKLVTLSGDIEARTEKTDLGDYATAIAALKSMLATYEGLYREQAETLTMMHQTNGDVSHMAASVMNKASETPSVDSIEAMRDNGQIDDTTYAIMMLEHHNIQIEFEEAPF
jgi:hypothetical protein